MIMSLSGHGGAVRSLAVSPDGRRIVSAGVDKTLMLWNTLTGQAMLTLTGHTGQVTSLAFSADGGQIVSGGLDKTVRIWSAVRP